MSKNMQKIIPLVFVLILLLLPGCGSPNDPESIIGGDGGYKIVSKLAVSGFAQDVVLNDSLVFISQGQAGLIIISALDPGKPKLLSELTYGLRGYSYKLAIKDSIIYLAAGTFGVNTVNVKDPLKPVITQENRAISPAKNFHLMGNYLFTAVSEEGVNISKITDPAHPDIRQTFFVPGFAQSVCTSTDSSLLFIACGEVGLTIYDISDFQDGYNIYPVVGWLDTPGYAEDVAIHPDQPVVFIACGTGGLVIADYQDTANVRIAGFFETGGYAKEVLYRGGRAYVATETRGLQIIDVTNINSPVRIGTVETTFAMAVAIDENFVYLADEDEGLVIISIP
jgi:hypothetical protein